MKVDSANLPKIGCHGNVSWGIEKTGTDRLHSHKYLPFGEKIVKIGQVDPEIPLFGLIIGVPARQNLPSRHNNNNNKYKSHCNLQP